MKRGLPYLFILAGFFCTQALYAQETWNLKGTIYDNSGYAPVESVIVQTTSGRGTLTDTFGRYTIRVNMRDSVYFSYQGKVTGKYPVATMQDITQFNLSLKIRTITYLPNVTVRGMNYRQDSLANRQYYSRYFNYEKANPLKSINVGPTGVGMDPNEIINLFRFRRNRQLASLQRRLITEEEEKYINFRFNRIYVKRLTGLDGEELTRFMEKYRPPYDFVSLTNDIELGYYIQQAYLKDTGKNPSGLLLSNHGVDSVIYR